MISLAPGHLFLESAQEEIVIVETGLGILDECS